MPKTLRKVLIIIAGVVIVFLAGFLILKYVGKNAPGTIKISNTIVKIQEAKSGAEINKGMAGLPSLPADSGMLYVFATKSVDISYQPKGMLFPVDVIWIKDGSVVRIDKNIEAPGTFTPDSQIPMYSPGTLIDYILEVNAGFADKNGIKVGDRVNLSGI